LGERPRTTSKNSERRREVTLPIWPCRWPVVDARDRGDLRGGAGQEDLVGQVEFSALHRTLLDGHSQLVAQQGDERPARDASRTL